MGNTITTFGFLSPATVHPHACGEYNTTKALRGFTGGSSPRVWGIRVVDLDRGIRSRFIPTRVGNTLCVMMTCTPWAVHPHACGEYFLPFRHPLNNGGSSPRVWGIPESPSDFLSRRRFIPTRVGNTSELPSATDISTVHPHACGEYDNEMARKSGRVGSSPRVWGILPDRTVPTL